MPTKEELETPRTAAAMLASVDHAAEQFRGDKKLRAEAREGKLMVRGTEACALESFHHPLIAGARERSIGNAAHERQHPLVERNRAARTKKA